MTQPTVSVAGQEFYDAVSQWHANDEAYGWAGLYWCEAIAQSSLQRVLDVSRDQADGTPGWANLLNTATCDLSSLPFIGQFVGAVIPPGSSRATALGIIASHAAGGRGRPSTIVAAVQATLTGSKLCVLTERDTSPYHATITVYNVQMPDNAATLAAIAAVKPAGLIITLQVNTGPTYAHADAALTTHTYAGRETRFPTYADVQGYV